MCRYINLLILLKAINVVQLYIFKGYFLLVINIFYGFFKFFCSNFDALIISLRQIVSHFDKLSNKYLVMFLYVRLLFR